MLRTILLLSPIYVALFWSIALTGIGKKQNTPQLILSTFMLFQVVCFAALFLYFINFRDIYPFFYCALQYAGSLAFPVYYIYFRLLTVDEKFSFNAHAQYLAIPFILASAFCMCVFLTPANEFNTWLYDNNAFPDSLNIQVLNVLRDILRIQLIVQVVITVIGNQILIKKYGVKAEQFYSDMENENYNNAKLLNYCIIIVSIVSMIAVVAGYFSLIPGKTLPYIICSISSVMFYIIGYMGIKQKPINATFKLTLNEEEEEIDQLEVMPVGSRKKILNKMLVKFEDEKIYLNSQLNIMDIVQAVGTNRTYISSIINQHYNQNFCSFVNSYRIKELERVVIENPDYTNEILAECCGFGSLNSLKRAVNTKTGLSFPEWKRLTLTGKN